MSQAARKGWLQALSSYRHPRVIAMLFLGFSAGLPLLLVFGTLSAWLREGGVDRSTIGYLSWVGTIFSIKVFWAPVVDRLPLPGLTRLLGKRRGWMLLAQLGIAAGLLGLSTFSDPAANVTTMALLALWVAFCSATQDIVIDAYRIEAVEDTLQAAMAATYQLGYRIAMLVAGAGALYIADGWSWNVSYSTMAALMGLGLVTVLVIREPQRKVSEDTLEVESRLKGAVAGERPDLATRMAGWFLTAVVAPFVDFFRRYGHEALLILAFIAIYRISDISMGVMANTFYIDLGFTKTQIANVTKVFGTGMTIVGMLLGGVVVARYGLRWPLVTGAVLASATNLLFAGLAVAGKSHLWLIIAITGDNFAGGLASTVFIAYLSSLTNKAYTATQYALFSSLMLLVPKIIGGFSGTIVDAYGYVSFYIYSTLIGLPAVILALVLVSRSDPAEEGMIGPAYRRNP